MKPTDPIAESGPSGALLSSAVESDAATRRRRQRDEVESSSEEEPDRRPSARARVHSPSLSGASSSSSFADGSSTTDDEEDGDVDIQLQLLTHAKVTAESARLVRRGASGSDSAGRSVSKFLSGAGEDPMKAALRHMRDELTKPVEHSTALTVVNASDESADVMSHVVASKLPPAPPGEAKKLRKLSYVDHSTMTYISIRKDFYVAPPDVKDLTAEEIKLLLKELDGAKVRGDNVPKPLRSWHGVGLADEVLGVLERRGFQAPFAVQSVGAPVLMSGRDLLVTAKTGSGKTLCYALPMIRHCVAQPRCGKGEGPIGLVLVPTQELAAQVFHVLRELTEAAELRCVASYGSTSLSDNIRQARAGCDVMVSTPGRLLDLLTVNGGNVIALQRTSFVVVDEADRLFDSGFMEHVEAFLKNIRPDRQVAMISATMPKELKKMVLRHMNRPVEISIGGKPTPASNVEQLFYFFDEEVYEVDTSSRKEDARFVKLMQILGDEGGGGEHLILIFTQRKEEVDELFGKLSTLGYQHRIASLYSGMDPIDREFALENFRPGGQFILIATAVAERGLDIPYLELVINYSLPNHYEAYVHRIGRTGRAGRRGKAASFFTRGRDDDIAPELVEGLERAEQQIPAELYEIAAKARELRADGVSHHRSSFYRGYLKAKKQRFTERDQKDQVRVAAKAAGLDGFLSSSESGTDSDAESTDGEADIVAVSADQRGSGREALPSTALTLHSARSNGAVALSTLQEDRIAKALAFAEKTTRATTAGEADGVRFQLEYPINDLADAVRGRLQSAAFLRSVAEETDTTIVKKGVYYDPRYKHSHRMKEGERPLYLLIIGRTTEVVQKARQKLNDMKAEALSRIKKAASVLGAEL